MPSDDAVLDTVLRSGGVDPSDVHRVTIGFNAVADLAAGKVDAATAFWNAEGVQLQQMGIPIREFRVDRVRRPAVSRAAGGGEIRLRGSRLQADRCAEPRVRAARDATPIRPSNDLLEEVPGLDRATQRAQLDALTSAEAFSLGNSISTPRLDRATLERWQAWAIQAGLLRPASRAPVRPAPAAP